jgi:phosphosulfolactate synthase (CoM biosynthesis protein A)
LLSDVSLSSLVQECKDLGFDAIEVNTDLICLQEEDLLRLIRTIKSAGLKARPELGIKSAEDGIIHHSNYLVDGEMPLIYKIDCS